MVYSYECKKCGLDFSITCSVKRYEKLKRVYCPQCLSERVVRDYEVMLGIHYKDKGFTKHVQEEE